jgi:hypothetical protein
MQVQKTEVLYAMVENASTETVSTNHKDGKCKYGKLKYEYAMVENASTENVSTVNTVPRLIVKPDGSRYCTSTNGTIRIGCNECVDTLLTKSSMSTWHKGNCDTRSIKAHITRC